MGWIKIVRNPRILLHTSMSILVCMEDEKITLLETEKLPEVVKTLGRTVTRSELEEIDRFLREQTRSWWSSYRQNFTGKKGGKNGVPETQDIRNPDRQHGSKVDVPAEKPENRGYAAARGSD
ncbi:MAG: hypothetical protein QW334_01155 [Thermofilum sp.]